MAKRPHCSQCSVVQIIYQMLTEMHASAKANPPNSDYKLSQTGAELEAIILIQIRRDPATHWVLRFVHHKKHQASCCAFASLCRKLPRHYCQSFVHR